jgi:hypothetical protein
VDLREDLLRGHHLLARPDVVAVERHELDVADLPGPGPRHAGEVDDLVVVHPAHHHHVDLERPEPGGVGRLDPLPRLAEAVAPRDVDELLPAERVEADVEPPEARLAERTGELREQDPVRRHRQVLHPRGRRDEPDQVRQVPARGGLAAGEAEVRDPERHGHPDDPADLLEGQDLRLGHPLGLRRHAVDAAEVAPVGDREAQVRDGAAVAVDEHRPIVADRSAGFQTGSRYAIFCDR